MSTYKDLLAQREELERLIAAARQAEVATAVAEVQRLVAEYALTSEQVFPKSGRRGGGASKGMTISPRYRDPKTGLTWTGRGKAPNWIKDKRREDFLIA